MEKHISIFPNVCAEYYITGLTDMIIIAKFRNRKELSDFVKRDLALPYIERTNSHIVLVTVKEDFRLMQIAIIVIKCCFPVCRLQLQLALQLIHARRSEN